MQRRREKQTAPFEDRLSQMAQDCKEKAATLPPGPERDLLMRKARQAETASHLSEWAASPGLKSPE
jgi:hypothetical protein